MPEPETPVRPLGPYANPEPTAAPATTNGATSPTDPGGATHYKSLEDADRAARDFQSRYDQLAAENQKIQAELAPFGGLKEAKALIQQVQAVVNRSDWQSYMRGELVPQNIAPPPEDEYLTEEQRQIRKLSTELENVKRGNAQGDARMHSELAALRFERAEKEMREMYGEHWDTRRPQILREIQKLGATTGPNGLDLIDATLLNKAFLASFDSPREFEEFQMKWSASRDAARRALLASKGTTPPHQTAPAGAPESAPKTPYEAFQRGWAETQEQLRNGGLR